MKAYGRLSRRMRNKNRIYTLNVVFKENKPERVYRDTPCFQRLLFQAKKD